MTSTEAPLSVPTSIAMRRLLIAHADRQDVPISEIVRQAIDWSATRSQTAVDGISKPFISARITPGQRSHLRSVASSADATLPVALEAILCDYLMLDEAPATDAADEPDLFA